MGAAAVNIKFTAGVAAQETKQEEEEESRVLKREKRVPAMINSLSLIGTSTAVINTLGSSIWSRNFIIA